MIFKSWLNSTLNLNYVFKKYLDTIQGILLLQTNKILFLRLPRIVT